MSSFVKKLMAAGTALSIGISSYAVANLNYSGPYNNNCCPPACCPTVCETPCCGSWCDNFSFDAAWLYWKASGNDFHYAVDKARYVSGSTGTGSSIFTSREKFHDIDFDWNSGFRIGVGVDLPCQGWGIYVDWTHYDTSSKSKKHIEGDTQPPISITAGFPVINHFSSNPLGEGQSVDFKGNLKIRYNTVDIELGKWCNCDCCFSFRPHVGLRLADIQERFRDFVRGNGTGVQFDGIYSSAGFHHKNRFKGAGVRVGVDTNLCLCDGWSFIGRGAASAIWGTTHLKNILRTSTITVVDAFIDEIKEDYRQVRFITDLSFGIRWRTMACGCYPLTVEFAWEHHYLFNQHRYWVADHYGTSLETTSSWKSTGDVAFQGLTLTVGFDF